MLQSMREKMQGIIAGIIVGLIALTFALWGVQYYLRGGGDTGVVAKVNGEKITDQQVRRIYSRAQQQELAVQGKDSSFDQKAQAQLKEKIIQQIIKNKILLSLANKLGLYIGKQQIQAGIMELPIFQSSSGGFSPSKFQQILNNFFYSEQDFVQELQGSLMLGQLEEGIIGSSFVLPYEENDAIKLLQQSRDFGYCIVDMQQFASKVAVSDAEIQQYYDKHKNEYVTAEQVSVAYIELNADAVKSQVERNITDAKLEQFYKEHIDQFNKAKTTRSLPFVQVKNKVKDLYIRQTTQQLLADQSDKLSDLTYTNSDSLEPAATTLGLTIKTTELFSRQGGKAGISANSKIVKAAFSDAVLSQGYNSNSIELGDNDIVVLRIKQHIPEAVLPLTQVRQKIEVAIKQNKMQELSKQRAQDIVQALREGQNVSNLSKKYGFVWRKVNKVTRDFAGIDKNIVKAVFALPKPQYQKNAANLVDLQGKGFAVVQVTNVYDGMAKKTTDKTQQGIFSGMQNAWGQYEYNLLVNDAMQKAKITIEKTTAEQDNV